MTSNPIQLQNNFNTFKEDFKSDTGLEFGKETIHIYIPYFNARVNDLTSQVVSGLTSKLLNRLNELPDETSLRIAEMIRTHETIRALLPRKS